MSKKRSFTETRSPTSSPSSNNNPNSPNKKRASIKVEEKKRIFEFHQNYIKKLIEHEARQRAAKKKLPPPHGNDTGKSQSWRQRPKEWVSIGASTWRKIIAEGEKAEEETRSPEWRAAGRQTTLTDQESLEFCQLVTQLCSQGELLSNDSINVWAIQYLGSLPRFKEMTSSEQTAALKRIGGRNWIKEWKKKTVFVSSFPQIL